MNSGCRREACGGPSAFPALVPAAGLVLTSGCAPPTTNETESGCPAIALTASPASACIRLVSHSAANVLGAETVSCPSAMAVPEVPASHVSNVAFGVRNCNRPRAASQTRCAELSEGNEADPTREIARESNASAWPRPSLYGGKGPREKATYHVLSTLRGVTNPPDSRANAPCKRRATSATPWWPASPLFGSSQPGSHLLPLSGWSLCGSYSWARPRR